jgi:hypothetical protein
MGAGQRRRSSVVVLVACLVALGVMGLSPAASSSAASGPIARTACHRLGEKEPRSPCVIGNILFSCGYALQACEYSRYFKCHVSGFEGKVVKVVEDKEEELETTEIVNPHKTMRCKGSATILKVYIWKGPEAPYTYKLVKTPAHSFVLTLYSSSHGPLEDGLVVMAQS